MLALIKHLKYNVIYFILLPYRAFSALSKICIRNNNKMYQNMFEVDLQIISKRVFIMATINGYR